MDEQQLLPEVPTDPKRSQLLTILCILTFIGSGLNTFSSLFIAVFFDTFQVVAEELYAKLNLPGLEILMGATPQFFLVNALLYVGSVVGALFMWRQQKLGFHIYTIAQILLILAPMYFMHLPGPSFLEVLLSGVFIILYSSQLKQMH
jgi:hypothetical protein